MANPLFRLTRQRRTRRKLSLPTEARWRRATRLSAILPTRLVSGAPSTYQLLLRGNLESISVNGSPVANAFTTSPASIDKFPLTFAAGSANPTSTVKFKFTGALSKKNPNLQFTIAALDDSVSCVRGTTPATEKISFAGTIVNLKIVGNSGATIKTASVAPPPVIDKHLAMLNYPANLAAIQAAGVREGGGVTVPITATPAPIDPADSEYRGDPAYAAIFSVGGAIVDSAGQVLSQTEYTGHARQVAIGLRDSNSAFCCGGADSRGNVPQGFMRVVASSSNEVFKVRQITFSVPDYNTDIRKNSLRIRVDSTTRPQLQGVNEPTKPKVPGWFANGQNNYAQTGALAAGKTILIPIIDNDYITPGFVGIPRIVSEGADTASSTARLTIDRRADHAITVQVRQKRVLPEFEVYLGAAKGAQGAIAVAGDWVDYTFPAVTSFPYSATAIAQRSSPLYISVVEDNIANDPSPKLELQVRVKQDNTANPPFYLKKDSSGNPVYEVITSSKIVHRNNDELFRGAVCLRR